MLQFNTINTAGLELIKKFEGFSAAPYLCPANKLTIGYGHVILPDEKFTSLTEQQASDLLLKDANVAIKAVDDLVGVQINQNQFSALVSFVFNLGRGNFATSSLLKTVNAEKHLDVPSELIKWKMAAGNPLKGLLMRRLAESTLYLS